MSNTDPPNSEAQHGLISRQRALALALVIATGVVLYLCYRIVRPFLPALAWALALSVLAYPLHRRILQRISFPNLAAGISVAIVALIIVAPAVFVTQQVVQEVTRFADTVQANIASGRWRAAAEGYPEIAPIYNWVESQIVPQNSPRPPRRSAPDERPSRGDGGQRRNNKSGQAPAAGLEQVAPALNQAATAITGGVRTVVTGTIWFAMQMFVTLMALFFFLRDRRHALDSLRSLLPLSHSEADEVFDRVDNTIYATVFGSVVVAFVQGFMGGLMFWLLGIPSPLVWGAIMGLLAVIPVLGTFVIWMPVAAFLAIQGDWGKAAILVAWGSIAIGLIDNFLYPIIVGKRMRFHTLLVFIAIVGGLLVFGASGIVLGPLLLAMVDALLDIWRRRTAFGGALEEKPPV